MLNDRDIQIETIINLYKSINNVKPRFMDFDKMSLEELDEMVNRLSNENSISLNGFSNEDIKLAYAMGAENEEDAVRWAKQMNNGGV